MNVTTFATVFRSAVSDKISYFRRANFFDMVGVTGSIPVAPTINFNGLDIFVAVTPMPS